MEVNFAKFQQTSTREYFKIEFSLQNMSLKRELI